MHALNTDQLMQTAKVLAKKIARCVHQQGHRNGLKCGVGEHRKRGMFRSIGGIEIGTHSR